MCQHYFLIPEANGKRTLIGRCKYCGEEKEFKTSLPDWLQLDNNIVEGSFDYLKRREMLLLSQERGRIKCKRVR
jgi:hypothetical protein